MQKRYISISEDGSLEMVTETRQAKNLNAEIINKLSSQAVRVVKDAFLHNWQPVTILTSSTETFACVMLNKLSINSTFKIGSDKLLRPLYLSNDQKAAPEHSSHPQFTGVWQVPEDMNLMFACKIFYDPSAPEGERVYTSSKNACLLIAWDSAKKARRLPIPNLYDNCYMCMGEFASRSNSIQEVLTKAMEQLDRAPWNSDLLNDSRQDGSDNMFTFKPGANNEMENVPYTGNWTYNCPTAGSAVIELLGGAL